MKLYLDSGTVLEIDPKSVREVTLREGSNPMVVVGDEPYYVEQSVGELVHLLGWG
jgi:hypothetical protein